METPEAVSQRDKRSRDWRRRRRSSAWTSFLDRAVLQGYGTVTVIHGIGRGILKRALYDVLKKDPRVSSVRPGEPAHGGDGVAIVDLR